MIYWNKKFTELIRQGDGSLWGNWSMVGNVDLGAYGVINPETAEFDVMGNVFHEHEEKFSTAEKRTGDFIFMTSGVKKHDVATKIDGTFIDPETGTKINGGVKFSWGFSRSTDLLAQYTAVRSKNIQNTQNLMKIDVFKTLKTAAGTKGYLNGSGGIKPGFVVITSVVRSAGGFMIGSQSDNQTFSIGGSAKGTSALVEGLKAGGKASYAFSEASESIVKYVFPSPNEVISDTDESERAPIAFKVITFDGNAMLSNWQG